MVGTVSGCHGRVVGTVSLSSSKLQLFQESTPYQMDGTPSRTGASAKSRFSAKSLSRSSFNTNKSAGNLTKYLIYDKRCLFVLCHLTLLLYCISLRENCPNFSNLSMLKPKIPKCADRDFHFHYHMIAF